MTGFVAALLVAHVSLSAPVAIQNVRVEVGDGTVHNNATVIFRNARIVAVGRNAAPSGAEIIDGTGKVLTPGLVETLTQLGLTEVSMVSRTNDHTLEAGAVVPGFRAAEAFNPNSVRIPVNREEGVTSAIVSPGGTLLYGSGAWFDLSGTLDGMPNPTQPAALYGGVHSRAAAGFGGARGGLWLRLREVFDEARFYAANRSAYDKGATRRLSLAPVHLRALMPLLGRKIPLVLYVYRMADIRAALGFAAEQNIRLVLAGATEAWMLRHEIAKAGVPVIIKPTDQSPWSFDTLGARDDAPALLRAAGVQLVITAGNWDNNIRRLRQEAGLAVAAGLAQEEAIRAITSTPAAVFGRGDQIGTIAKGRRADLVLWSGDPLELDSVAEKIWIRGVLQSMDHRQRRLVERYLPTAEQKR